MAPTKTRQSLSIGTKMKIIAERRKGHSNSVVAGQFNLSKSTVSTIWGQRDSIEKHISKCQTPTEFLKKSYLSTACYDKVDQACYAWLKQQRGKGITISGPLLQKKALLLGEELYPDSYTKFEASSGWLCSFKKRHGIQSLSSPRNESLDFVPYEPFEAQLRRVIAAEGLTRDQLFNADETSVYWRLLPDQNGEKKNKTAKDRVTLLSCANASGTCKLPLAFVHEAAKEHCYEGMDDLPVDYFTQKNSWMDANLFKKWFFDKFLPYVQAFCIENNIPPKVILVLDNALAHPLEEELSTEDGSVRVMYLSLNKSEIQPMSRGILESLKKRYKKNLLRHVLCHSGTPRNNVIKRLMIMDAVYWSASAWIGISQESLKRSWGKLLVDEEVVQSNFIKQEIENDTEVRKVFKEMFEKLGVDDGMSLDEWLEEDAGDPSTRHQWLITAKNAGAATADSEVVEDEGNNCQIKPEEAFKAIQTVMQWVEQFEDTDANHVRQLRKWRDEAAEMAFK